MACRNTLSVFMLVFGFRKENEAGCLDILRSQGRSVGPRIDLSVTIKTQ